MPISPKRLLLANNLHAKRWLGQHFLTDRQTAEKIVILSNVGPEDIVLEIGPGLGALTLPMAGTAKKIYTVEKDREIIPLLESELASDHITNVEVMIRHGRYGLERTHVAGPFFISDSISSGTSKRARISSILAVSSSSPMMSFSTNRLRSAVVVFSK